MQAMLIATKQREEKNTFNVFTQYPLWGSQRHKYVILRRGSANARPQAASTWPRSFWKKTSTTATSLPSSQGVYYRSRCRHSSTNESVRSNFPRHVRASWIFLPSHPASTAQGPAGGCAGCWRGPKVSPDREGLQAVRSINSLRVFAEAACLWFLQEYRDCAVPQLLEAHLSHKRSITSRNWRHKRIETSRTDFQFLAKLH